MGPFGSPIKVSTYVPDGVPIINGKHLRGVRVDDPPGFNFVSHDHAKRLANADVRRGDLIVAHSGVGLRVLVKRILRKHGYPPDKQESATRTVLEQAELLSVGTIREGPSI